MVRFLGGRLSSIQYHSKSIFRKAGEGGVRSSTAKWSLERSWCSISPLCDRSGARGMAIYLPNGCHQYALHVLCSDSQQSLESKKGMEVVEKGIFLRNLEGVSKQFGGVT